MASHHEKALEAARAERWDEAHEITQAHDDPLSAHIHGYLHRVEGDLPNARYWYDRAGVAFPENGVEEELGRLEGLAREG